jgi:hypothetical protein
MRPRLALLIVLLLAPLAALGPAAAQPAQPLDRLLPEIRRSMPGQVLDAEPGPSEDGAPRYRLKWLTPDGRVIYRDVDARNGRVMAPPPPDRANRGNEAPRAERGDGPQRGNFRSEDEGGDNRGFGLRRQQFDDPRAYGQDRFNRPSYGDGGFGARGNDRGARRFGGGEPPQGRFGGNERFGGDGGQGRFGGEGRGRFGGGRARGRND